MNTVIKSLLAHRSIRTYQDTPVSQEAVAQIIQAVQAAPNWVNVQLVSIIAVRDKERRKRFAALCGNQRHISEAPVFLVFCADYYRTSLACGLHGQSLGEVLEDLDIVIVGAHEVGIAVGTAVAAAESLSGLLPSRSGSSGNICTAGKNWPRCRATAFTKRRIW